MSRGQAQKSAETKPNLAQRIRLARESAGYTRPEAEAALQVGKGMAQKWEMDEGDPNARTPKEGTLAAMANLYGVRSPWLLHGEGEMLPEASAKAAAALAELVKGINDAPTRMGVDPAWLRRMTRRGPRNVADAMTLEAGLLRVGISKRQAAAALGVKLDEADRVPPGMVGTVATIPNQPEPPQSWIAIPVYQITAAAGPGAMNGEHETKSTCVQIAPDVAWALFGPRRRSVAAIWIQGSSMNPSLQDGDMVFVDPKGGFQGEGIHAVRIDDLLVVKSLQMAGAGKIRMLSTNPEFPPLEMGIGDVEVIGPVLAKMGRV